MVWDCLIAWVVVICTTVGWSLGLLRSATVPVAIVIATFISQNIYIDVATVMADALQLEPSLAVFLGYFLTWLALVSYIDAILIDLFGESLWEHEVKFFSKLAGASIGFCKGFGAFVLASMVAYAQHQVPSPPIYSWQNHWIMVLAQDSFFLPKIHKVACQLDKPIGKFVLSDSAPRIQPGAMLTADPFHSLKTSEEKKGLEFAQSWKNFKSDMNDLGF